MRVRALDHEGLAATEMISRGTRLVVVHGVGPRIAWFGRTENLLYWDSKGEHRRGDWRLYGGHRLWLTRPGADEAEDTYAPDNASCRVTGRHDTLRVTAPARKDKIQTSLTIRALDEGFRITHRLRNAGDMLWSGGAWALTCTAPVRGTRYRIPLDGGDPRWDVISMAIPRRWGGGHTSLLRDSQFAFSDDALEVRALGREAKRMLGTPRGTLEMIDRRGHFVKTAKRIAGVYPLDANVAIYLAPRAFMVELETMSPIVTLVPGATLAHDETWVLIAP